MAEPSKISLTQHPSQDSGIGTSLHDRSDYDLAMSLALDGSSSPIQPSVHRPDIPLPTSFPRSADHPAHRILALANGRRMANTQFQFNDVANTIRLVDNYTGDSATDRARLPPSLVQISYERRIRARYALPALAEVSEGVSPRMSHASAAASGSATASRRSSGITEGEDYSFISFEAAEATPLTLEVPTLKKKSSEEEEEEEEGEGEDPLPSPLFPPENGSSRFRERFSLDGPEVFRASAESVVGEEERPKEDEKAGAKEGKKVCGSARVARVWGKMRKAFRKGL